MAIKQISSVEDDKMRCPRCGEEALVIEGKFVRWLTCPKCKFKKLMRKEDEKIKIVSLK
jgi:Zn finger protein HypA/HybF involved in hydrogenase expression